MIDGICHRTMLIERNRLSGNYDPDNDTRSACDLKICYGHLRNIYLSEDRPVTLKLLLVETKLAVILLLGPGKIKGETNLEQSTAFDFIYM